MFCSDQAERLAAIHHVTGPLEILAGHGTGKTTLLLERVVHLIRERVAWPYEILLLTFTRRAAQQMRERLQAQLDDDAALAIHTLHSFAFQLLAYRARELKQPSPHIRDPNTAFGLLRESLAEARLRESVWPAAFVAGLIADAKERAIAADEFAALSSSPAQRLLSQVYQRYQDRLAQAGALDFADLVLSARRVLEDDPAWREQVQARYRFVMVDEWQDTSLGQYALIRLLLGSEQNLFVAGSAAQSIYEWRHAHHERLARAFAADFPDARRIRLRDNFRSTEPIVRAAGALFRPGQFPEVALTAQRGPGERVRDVRLATEQEEAAFVAGEIAALAAGGIAPNEIAVLYRTNRQGMLLEREFIQRGVPYVLPQKQRLYHRREVRDLLAYLSLAMGDDDGALQRILNSPPRQITPAAVRVLCGDGTALSLSRLQQAEKFSLKPEALAGIRQLVQTLAELRAARTRLRPAALIDLTLERSGYAAWLDDQLDGEARLNSLRELQREAEGCEATAGFLSALRARIEADCERPDDEGVTLSTIHAAKGLQFGVVFVVGMEEGLLPSARAVESGAEPGERRLAHVAYSRARDRLYLVGAQSRERHGLPAFTRPSRYLSALPREIVQRYPR